MTIPALNDGQQAPGLSPRYRFIDTKPIVAAFEAEGYTITDAKNLRARKRDPRSVKHMVRMRHVDAPLINGVYPEIGIMNSHDGTSKAALFAGMFRLVCSNGLVIMSQQFAPTIRILHVGDAVEQAMKAAAQMSAAGRELAKTIPLFQERLLSHHEQVEFASRALDVAKIPHSEITISGVLSPKRPADAGASLWSTYNRVQEHLIGGGVTRIAANGRLRRAAGIRSIDRNYFINTQLWALMEHFLDH